MDFGMRTLSNVDVVGLAFTIKIRDSSFESLMGIYSLKVSVGRFCAILTSVLDAQKKMDEREPPRFQRIYICIKAVVDAQLSRDVECSRL
jgi:hypothetical protein